MLTLNVGLLITVAHIIAAIALNANLGRTSATVSLFLVGVMGGQGALIVFLTALGATLKMHSIISTSLVGFALHILNSNLDQRHYVHLLHWL